MSVEAERETLERKDRDELQKIAGALGGKVTSRTRKADIIEQILELTGVTGASGSDDGGSEEKASEEKASDEKAPPPYLRMLSSLLETWKVPLLQHLRITSSLRWFVWLACVCVCVRFF